MQGNFRLILWTIVSMATAWVVAMSINRIIFSRDSVSSGLVAIKNTDIGTQCGGESENNEDLVEYSVNTQGMVTYLCPQEFWPIQKIVTAVTLTEEFRKSLPIVDHSKVDAYYPQQPAQAPANPFVVPTQQK